jgi:hypothetical protein
MWWNSGKERMMKREEEFTGEDKAVFAGFVTACVVVGVIIGMALMYGWLALNGQIVALQ